MQVSNDIFNFSQLFNFIYYQIQIISKVKLSQGQTAKKFNQLFHRPFSEIFGSREALRKVFYGKKVQKLILNYSLKQLFSMINYPICLLIIITILQTSQQLCSTKSNCNSCPNPQICDQCEQNFILINDDCHLKVQNGLQVINDQSQNFIFATSQTLSFSGIGADPLNSCAYWLSDLRVCAFCNDGFQLIMGDCRKKLQKCQQFDLKGRCNKCIPNLFLESNGNCLDLNCEKNGYYNCQICKDGFVKNFYEICLDPNCQASENGRCVKCNRAFHIKSGQILCKLISGVSGGSGSSDNSGSSGNSNGTTTTVTTVVTVKNVTKKQSTKTIVTESNSTQSTTTITTIVTISSGCLLFKLRGGCHRCQDDYFLINGLCQGIDQFCVVYDPINGTCYTCKQKYELINNRCVSRDPSENCLVFENEECMKCIKRYYLLNGICLQVDRSCLTYNQSDGLCQTCTEGYELINGKCLLIFSLSENQDEQSGKQEEGLVSQFSKFYCLQYRGQTDYCLKCYARFYARNGFCWRVNPLCRTYDEDEGFCLSCYQGYRLDERQCLVDLSTKPLLNCKEYSPQTNLCLTCMRRYFTFEGICLQVFPECKDYDPDTGYCTTCFNGYFLLQGQCQIVATALSVPFCQNYNPLDPRQCLKCVSGFYLRLNQCKQVSDTCGAYNDKSGFCLNCISKNYQLVQGKCLEKVKNCRFINLKRQCVICEDGFNLEEGECRN